MTSDDVRDLINWQEEGIKRKKREAECIDIMELNISLSIGLALRVESEHACKKLGHPTNLTFPRDSRVEPMNEIGKL